MALTKVSSSLVSDSAVTSGKIADGGVATADIATNAVTSTKIAQNSILTKHIDDGQVTTDQLGADAVTAAKIADDAISEEHLDITVITSLTAVTAATGDLLMVADVSDSNNLKKIPVSSILAGTHTGAVNTSGTISSGAITAPTGTAIGQAAFSSNILESNNTGNAGARIRLAVSSEGNPTYSFQDDTNTGMFTSGADTLNFATGGTERLRINSTGIDVTGTATMDGLTVDGLITLAGSTSGTRTVKDSYSNGALSNQGFLRSSGGNYWGYSTYQDGSANWKSAVSVASERAVYAMDEDTAYWSFAPSQTVAIGSDLTTQPSEKIRFNLQNGRVGIGTASPDLKLDVTHATAAEYIATFQNSGNNNQLKIGNQAQGYLNIQGARIDNGNPYNFSLQADGGNVGIGTTTPSSQLVVAASNGGKGIETQVTTHATNNQFILAYDRANSAYLNMELSALNFGIATNNGTNRFKILANGNVGIGTASPTSILELKEASIVPRITLLKTGILTWYIGNPSQGTSNNFTIGTDSGANTEILTLTNDGNLLVGNTVVNPASGFASQRGFGYAASTGKVEIATTANAAVMELGKNNANDGSILVFRKQSNTVGNIGTFGGTTYFASNSHGFLINGTQIEPCNNSGGRLNNTVDIGSSTYNFKDLYLSNNAIITGATPAVLMTDSDTSNTGAIEQAGTHCYLGTSSSTGSIYFKNNFSNSGRPSVNGDVLMLIADGGNVTFVGNTSWEDNKKAYFGGGYDGSIFSDGTSGYIRGFSLQNKAGDKDVLTFADGGATNIFHNNAIKLATIASGIQVTGNLNMSGTLGTSANDLDLVYPAGSGKELRIFRANGNTVAIFNEGEQLLLGGATSASDSASGVSVQHGSQTNKYGFRHDGAGKYVRIGCPNASFAYIETNASSGIRLDAAVSKASGSFRIKHPLPSKNATHDLVHSFIEGPQADNIYRGVTTLVSGSVTINIDTVSGMTEGTYVLLNTNTSCFTSNETDWDAVKGSVTGNILTITCKNASSTATVSWLVIGERHDQHMKDTGWTNSDGTVIVEPLQDVR